MKFKVVITLMEEFTVKADDVGEAIRIAKTLSEDEADCVTIVEETATPETT